MSLQDFHYPILLADGASIQTVDVDQYAGVLGIMKEAFPDVSAEFFESITLNDPWYQPGFSLVVDSHGSWLAHVQLFERVIWMNGKPARIGGIGSVGTRERYRGYGYATTLLKHAEEIMRAADFQAAILFTGINGFYEKLGWKTLLQHEVDIVVEDLPRLADRDEFRGIETDDYPVLQAMYSALQAQQNGMLVRDLEYWHARPTWLRHLPIMVLKKDKAIGYFFATQFRKNENVFNISEFGLAENSTEAIETMLAVMGKKAIEYGCHTIRGFLFQHPAVRDYLTARGLVKNKTDFRFMMWHDLNGKMFNEIQSLASQYSFLYWQSDGV